MGVRKYVGRLMGMIAIGGAIYTAGVLTSDSAKDAAFYAMHPKAQIEMSYCQDFGQWHKSRIINQKGNIETYLVNENGYGLPCLEGSISMQLGNNDYIAGNLDQKGKAEVIEKAYIQLPQDKRAVVADKVWDNLAEEQKIGLVVDNYDQLSPGNQEALADSLMEKCYKNKWDAFKKGVREWWDGMNS